MNQTVLSTQTVDNVTIAPIHVGKACLTKLVKGENITTAFLSDAMTNYHGGDDSTGAWNWKQAYEALECSLVMFVQEYGSALSKMKTERLISAMERLHGFCPTHTKRSEESQKFQQFSTPLTIGLLAVIAGNIREGDTVLEPSAGTGMLAVLAKMKGAGLYLNELCDARKAILQELFKGTNVTGINAEYINDYLAEDKIPNVVLMNPPFSSSPNGNGLNTQVTYQHILSALHRLPENGRLIAITGESFSPYTTKWRKYFDNFHKIATLRGSIPLSGKFYYKHGTTIKTRIHVFDKVPAERDYHYGDSLPLIENIDDALSAATKLGAGGDTTCLKNTDTDIEEVVYTVKEQSDIIAKKTDAIYQAYETKAIAIEGAQPHPSKLVESAALASVSPPVPSYRPLLPKKIITEGILSEPQIENTIYAGEAHSKYLDGYFIYDENDNVLRSVSEKTEGAKKYRKGFYNADATGCGKGRESSGIILDNRNHGRKKALWISKSSSLLEDAIRDWVALGGNELDIIPQSKFKLGENIEFNDGILFTTYSTLRSGAKGKKKSRLDQIIDWVGVDFDGPIIFDEAHAMANALDSKDEDGRKKEASQQGRIGLQLQNMLPEARVTYFSATGAKSVGNLAYCSRLGLWATETVPFTSQGDFVSSMERGGVAAMEVIARDLKSMGLYLARSLSYEGVEYEMLEHDLSDEQISIYNAYADAFKIIHQNIDAALEATNVTSVEGKSYNGNAKGAAKAAFESNKQRFFNHLVMSMLCPTLIKAIENDLEHGFAPVIQIVSTNESLMERRLATIPANEWHDLQIDITPREYVMDYLENSFPVFLYEVSYDSEGKATSTRATDEDGNPVICREALQRKEQLIDRLAMLPSIPGALDQIIQYFGYEKIAEATGRSRRIVKIHEDGRDKLSVQNRPQSSNTSETHAFMDGKKDILIFSDAGGTGRSYHADKNAVNQRRRKHYLLEPGWNVFQAVQGLGRTNRTNQTSAPILRPCTTNVKGQKRFISTIASRLDMLGAITKGQRETGAQGVFKAEDNLNSHYARAALRDLLQTIAMGQLSCCSLDEFEESTGLSLMYEGCIRDELPPLNQFLNRLLALRIDMQNELFQEFESRIILRINAAKEAGIYEKGLEMIYADSMILKEQTILKDYDGAQAATICNRITRKDKMTYEQVDKAIRRAERKGATFVKNGVSGRVAYQFSNTSYNMETGGNDKHIEIDRPASLDKMSINEYERSSWEEISIEEFRKLWQNELDTLPEYRESDFYLISGVLLPVWRKLAKDNMRVCRVITDDNIALLGRLVKPSEIGKVFSAFARDDAPEISANDIFDQLTEDRQVVLLKNGLELRPVSIMGNTRIEVSIYPYSWLEKLKDSGCMSENISYKMRYFVPLNDDTIAIISNLQLLK